MPTRTLRTKGCLLAACLVAALVLAPSSNSASATALPAKAKARSPEPAFTYINTDDWTSDYSLNPFSPSFPVIGYEFMYLPLAIQIPPTLTRYMPQLASSWSVKGRQLVVNLRTGVKWQNGQRFTSKDVYDAALLDGANGSVMADVSALTMRSPRQIVFRVAPGIPMALAEETLLGITPVPAGIYGKFVTTGLEQAELAYYAEAATNPTAASASPQHTTMANALKAVVAFRPTTMVGDGPFRLAAINSFEAKLKRWKGFYSAEGVHVSTLDVVNASGGNGAIYPELYSGRGDYTTVYMPPSILRRWSRTADAHTEPVPWFQIQMSLNDHKYPLDLTKVRQALAYVIPRAKMVTLTYGTKDPGGVVVTHPDGLLPSVQSTWLTKKQIESLNPYAVNLPKAAALLRSVGFHKRHGKWFEPNGKQFILSLTSDAGQTNVVADFDVAATALNAFGIKSSVVGVSQATWESDQTNGTFEIIDSLVGGTDPLQSFNSVLGTGLNFISKAQRGVGFGPEVLVPGLGRVNVPRTIYRESLSVGPGSTMKRLTWDWARLVNRQLPYLQYVTYANQNEYSTARYVDWPPRDNVAWATGANPQDLLLLAFEQGYIRPR